MTIYDRIRQRLAELEISPRAASLRVGTNAELIRKLLDEESDPRDSTVEKIAAALGTTGQWLRTGIGPTSPSDGGRQAPTTDGFSLLAAVPLSELQSMLPQDMAVVGTAAGGAIGGRGGFEIEPRVIDVVRRPPALQGIAEAYAILVTGASMDPEHRPGDLRFVNPLIRPNIGDSVIVSEQRTENDPPEGYIGHLTRRNSEKIVLGKLNPISTIEFDQTYVKAVHKVLTMNDLFMV